MVSLAASGEWTAERMFAFLRTSFPYRNLPRRHFDAVLEMLGEDVAVVVDAGTSPGGESSTIVDVTGSQGRVLRRGALSLDDLNEALEPLGATLTDEG